MMAIFVLAAALLALVIFAIVAWPLLRKTQPNLKTDASDMQARAQADALRDAASVIATEEAAGRINANEADARRQELLLRARAESSEDAHSTAPTEELIRPKYRLAALTCGLAAMAAAGLYAHLGRLDGLVVATRSEAQEAQKAPATQMSNEQILGMVSKLETRLTSAPPVIEDLKAWKMLARSQMTLNQPEKAAVAYRAVLALEKPTTDAEMDLVQALLAQSNGKPSSEAKKLLASAFARDPGDQKVLWLNAAAAQEIDDKAGAVRFLRLLLATLPSNQDEAKQVQKFIDELSK